MTSTPTPTTLDLDALQRLCDEARPGPWTDETWSAVLKGQVPLVLNKQAKRDKAFIAASRTALPALIAKCRELQAERDEWRGVAQCQTPGGSEFTTPKAVAEFLRSERERNHKSKCDAVRRERDLRSQLAAAQERIKAINKIAFNGERLTVDDLSKIVRIASGEQS